MCPMLEKLEIELGDKSCSLGGKDESQNEYKLYCVDCPLDRRADRCILDRRWDSKFIERDTKRLLKHAKQILKDQKEIPQG